MSGGPFDGKSDAFPGQRDQRVLGHSHFAAGPGMAVEAPDQKLQRGVFGSLIWKANDNHAATTLFGIAASKPKYHAFSATISSERIATR